jgi:hypothetical protein
VGESTLTSISDLFGMKRYIVASNSRDTERGILLKKFSEKTGKDIKYIAFRLTCIPTADLYFIEKQCDNYKGEWSKCFFGMLKVK